MANPSTQPATSLGRSRTVTRKGQVTLRKELHAQQATGGIGSFIGLLADRSSHRASLDELNEAAAAGWAGLPGADRACGDSPAGAPALLVAGA